MIDPVEEKLVHDSAVSAGKYSAQIRKVKKAAYDVKIAQTKYEWELVLMHKAMEKSKQDARNMIAYLKAKVTP